MVICRLYLSKLNLPTQNKTKRPMFYIVLIPCLLGPFGFIVPKTLVYLSFQSLPCTLNLISTFLFDSLSELNIHLLPILFDHVGGSKFVIHIFLREQMNIIPSIFHELFKIHCQKFAYLLKSK